ncbi:hypothetical protein M3197_07350 [Sporosarcina aquimarina]|uniref:hypothetical protein n=1 Tax=Sporosarcina aquimarina TaxID=114975 RepID=UPI00204099AA|nr:hypothetical protein [Sporosarcina aquimarina]MCM3757304.1 hypothetical protein [Sporosarcina aquimarina]
MNKDVRPFIKRATLLMKITTKGERVKIQKHYYFLNELEERKIFYKVDKVSVADTNLQNLANLLNKDLCLLFSKRVKRGV